jgi:hypothetical protein
VQAVLDRQGPQMRSASLAGRPWAWGRLVIAKTTTVCHLGAPRSRVVRVICRTWATCGKPKWPTVTACRTCGGRPTPSQA